MYQQKNSNGEVVKGPSQLDRDDQVRRASKIPKGGHPPDSYDSPDGFGSTVPFVVLNNSAISDMSRKPWDNNPGKPVVRENDFGTIRTKEEIAAHNARIMQCRPYLKPSENSSDD